jgi:hypothetical protein
MRTQGSILAYTHSSSYTHTNSRREVVVAKAAQRAAGTRTLHTNHAGNVHHQNDKVEKAQEGKSRGRVFKRGKWQDETPVANEVLLRDVTSTVCMCTCGKCDGLRDMCFEICHHGSQGVCLEKE